MGVNLGVDFSGVAEWIGAMEGVENVADSDEYMNYIIKCAHDEAVDEFNLQIAADAQATGAFRHMFEWGTAGINRGRTTRRMNPMNPEARLWKDILVGSGKHMAAEFVFVPSKVPVPNPTTTRTKISQKYLSRLQRGKAIFWNKASVMESGTPVTISPKPGGKLFIPLNGYQPPDARPIDIKRGFVMTTKSVQTNPGEDTAGTFTAYWQSFWNGRGSELMQTYADKYFLEDMNSATKGSTKAGRVGAPNPEAFKAEVAAAKKKARMKMKREARKRANAK